MMKSLLSAAILILTTLSFLGCKKDSEKTPLSLEEQGRLVYMSRCIACHNSDPKQPGSLGPEIAGTAEEVLRNKVLKGLYPDGYNAKRTTKMMPPMPELEDKIIVLHSYLASEAQK